MAYYKVTILSLQHVGVSSW